MSKDKCRIDIGLDKDLIINQSSGDLKEGIKRDDLTRISGYFGEKHIHTGTFSDTVYTDKSKK